MRKSLHVYDWDNEPADERPSEFQRSTGYGPLSGYHSTFHSTIAPDVQARRAPDRFGAIKLLVFIAVLMAVGACALYWFTRATHG